MDEQTQEQILNQALQVLSLIGTNPISDVSYKTVDGEVYSTFTISCKDTSGNTVELVKKTDKVADPAKVKQDILDAEQSISDRLAEIQDKKAIIVPQLDAVMTPKAVEPEASGVE
ncbi:hypothetical protein H0W80_00025 [Candidatus Saccharibacteria bacterium]|nr:hypothetical protein [Candidatus Saccharibacteria bacterium]